MMCASPATLPTVRLGLTKEFARPQTILYHRRLKGVIPGGKLWPAAA